jgi:hypothetical protein
LGGLRMRDAWKVLAVKALDLMVDDGHPMVIRKR